LYASESFPGLCVPAGESEVDGGEGTGRDECGRAYRLGRQVGGDRIKLAARLGGQRAAHPRVELLVVEAPLGEGDLEPRDHLLALPVGNP
jgi:hypothetical protein